MSEEEYEERRRQDIASFVQEGKVDWRRWHNLRGSDRGTSYNDALRENVINHLVDIGILSFTPEGNHRVAGEGLDLNPKVQICHTYFTSREQARDYANALFSRAQYGVRIEKLIDVEPVKSTR